MYEVIEVSLVILLEETRDPRLNYCREASYEYVTWKIVEDTLKMDPNKWVIIVTEMWNWSKTKQSFDYCIEIFICKLNFDQA
jgi:hypothetical protein